MSTITWLHLSDLHACNPRHGWDARRVVGTLVEDLRALQSERGLRPDMIFFTGDAAFGRIGSEGEQTVAGQLETFGTFLEAVRGAFEPEILLENVFLVPGNHDVDRTLVEPDQTFWLDHQESLAPVLSAIQQGGVQWRRYMERLDAYRDFLETLGFHHLLDAETAGTTHADPLRLIYGATREIRGLRVGIAGFNTAWSCCRNGELGKLWMAGRWQQETLRPGLEDTDLSIALMHHPPNWLVEYENPDFGRGLDRDFQFLLHGHEHRDWVLQQANGYSTLAAGACYESSTSESNGYNLVRLDASSGMAEVWLRGYDGIGGGWIPRIVAKKTDERGVWPIRFGSLRRADGMSGPAALDSSGLDSELKSSKAKDTSPEHERYLQRLRAQHRDLPIFGFETKVRLPIQIRDVYIPLRARLSHMWAREERSFGASRQLEEHEVLDRVVPFDETLALARQLDFRGVVVLGDPGSGKTTLLKHFVLASTDPMIGPASLGLPDGTVPVLVELRKLADPATDLRRMIAEAVAHADISLHSEAFTNTLLKEECGLLVLVDGLDEVADVAKRAAVSRRLELAIELLPKSTFVITSRYAGYRDDARLAGRFLELHVQDVKEEAARRFIGAWYLAVESRADLGLDLENAKHQADEATVDLVQKVFQPEDERTRSLRELAKNPLMLQILCLVHRDRKQLPERRVELYRECVSVLLELWRAAKKILITFDAQQALRLLQPLAYALHVAEKREAGLDQLLPHLEAPLCELRRDPEDGLRLLEAIRDQSGVLVSLGQLQYGFLHLSFQEYLTALHIQDQYAGNPRILKDLAEQFGDAWWREVILLSLGLNNPSIFEPLIAALLDAGVLHQDVALADDCLRDALAISARPFVSALARGIGDDEERYHVLRLMRGLTGWDAVEHNGLNGWQIVQNLAREETSPQVLSMAVELLGGQANIGQAKPRASAVLVPGARERVHEKDGSILVFVQGGEFRLGTDEDLYGYLEGDGPFSKPTHWSKPEHRVLLSDYWIGKYAVTNAQYRKFLRANPNQKKPTFWNDKLFDGPEQPVVGVSWLDAMEYCRWADLDLPSEAEWEAAARGCEENTYPWGAELPSPEFANYGGSKGATTPVGAYPKGVSSFGTLDQTGNVWEWCRDKFDTTAYAVRDGAKDPYVEDKWKSGENAGRVVRGGSWVSSAQVLPSANRVESRAGDRDEALGFRVVHRSHSFPEH